MKNQKDCKCKKIRCRKKLAVGKLQKNACNKNCTGQRFIKKTARTTNKKVKSGK